MGEFPYDIDWRLAPFWVPFGFRPARDKVVVSETTLRASFGFFHLETALENVSGAHITEHYRWWTAVGARMSWVDDGLTFGTNRKAGVCIHFAEKVPTPLKKAGHSALTVTVADLGGLVSALGSPPEAAV